MKKILIVLVIIIILILSLIIGIKYLNKTTEKEQNLVNTNDISYIQGPLKQNIEDLEYNNIQYIHVTDKQMAEKYFSNYIQMVVRNSKQSYKILDEEYKKNRFDTYEDYRDFIENRILYLKEIEINNIYVNIYNDYKEYKIKDKYGNTYIFKETAIMEYTLQLDDYTLENEEFNIKYKEASYRDKGLLNVDKFFKMINMQDYKAAYNVLDENFKQNYFKTQLDFENYMKNKVFLYNKVEYKEYSNKITDIYTYKVVLTDMTGESQNQVEFNITIKLLEGTDFVMSFEVN